MIKIITLVIIMLSFFIKGNAQYDQLATDFTFKDVEGKVINLAEFKEKVIVVVNVASRLWVYQSIQRTAIFVEQV